VFGLNEIGPVARAAGPT